MMDGTTLVVIAATFLLAGTVKGVIGLGLLGLLLVAYPSMSDTERM